MPEAQARTAFVLAHVPLLAVLLWLVSRGGDTAPATVAVLDGVHGRRRRAPPAALGETGVRVLVGLVAGAHLRHRRGRAGPPCSAGARRHRAVEPAAAGRREAPAFSVVRSFGVSAASTERCALSFTRLSVHLFYGAVLVT